jgi:peptidoglycan/LPS O-acetylase OafA/YrhL
MKQAVRSRDTAVDWFRLGLALSVVIFHINRWYGPWPPVHYWVDWAVPAFLAISGFYVLRSYEQSANWLEFIWKRVLRIVPAFLVSLALVAVAGGVKAALYVLYFYATLGIPRNPGLNVPVWSLGAEEIAYGVLAILFTLGAYRKVWPIWVAFSISIVVATFWVSISARVSLGCLPPCFFAGSLIYLYRDKVRPNPYWGIVLVGIALLMPPFYWLVPTPAYRWVPGVLMGTGILLLREVKMPRIPDLSYGCYVYHMPLVYLVKAPAIEYFPVLAGFCALSWYGIEKPALRLKRRGGGKVSAEHAASSAEPG